MPLSPSAQAYTAPLSPMVTTMQGMRALPTLAASVRHISSGPIWSYSSEKRIPASCWLQTKQSICCKKSRRSMAMLMLETAAYTFLWYFCAKYKTCFTVSFSRSSSMAMPSQSLKISSPFSASRSVRGLVSGRLEMAATTSPSLLNTASQVPMPSGTRWI